MVAQNLLPRLLRPGWRCLHLPPTWPSTSRWARTRTQRLHERWSTYLHQLKNAIIYHSQTHHLRLDQLTHLSPLLTHPHPRQQHRNSRRRRNPSLMMIIRPALWNKTCTRMSFQTPQPLKTRPIANRPSIIPHLLKLLLRIRRPYVQHPTNLQGGVVPHHRSCPACLFVDRQKATPAQRRRWGTSPSPSTCKRTPRRWNPLLP